MVKLRLSKAIEGFFIACGGRGLSGNTVRDYRTTFHKFITHVGDVDLSSIVPNQVSAFLAVQPVGNKTKLNYHTGLSALWTWAEREGYVEKHIVRMVERPRPKEVVIKPFTEIEVRAILSAVQHAPARNRALILLLFDTAARASEICNLERSDIDLTTRQIKVTGKGDKERLIPFSARTGSALFSHLATSEGRPFPLTRTSLSQYLRRLGKRAGVKDTYPHRFRHTAAITMLRCGMDIYSLQKIIGHSTLEMVKRYLAIAQIDIDAAHRRASPVDNWKL
jgi:site-specific recombinase XerD